MNSRCPDFPKTWDGAARRMQIAVQQLDDTIGAWASLLESLLQPQVAAPAIEMRRCFVDSVSNFSSQYGVNSYRWEEKEAKLQFFILFFYVSNILLLATARSTCKATCRSFRAMATSAQPWCCGLTGLGGERCPRRRPHLWTSAASSSAASCTASRSHRPMILSKSACATHCFWPA